MQEIKLPAVCDRATAEALHAEWEEHAASEPMVINAADVEKMSHAMLQLLVSAARTTAGATVTSPSEAMRSAIVLAGLQDTLTEAEPQ